MSGAAGESGANYPVDLGDGSITVAAAYEGERIMLIGDRAYPPGRPLTLALNLPDGPLSLQGKAMGSKLRHDGRYDVRVKLSSLRREQREALERAFAAPKR